MLGQLLELREPDSAPQLRTYDSSGAVTQTQWAASGSSPERKTIARYDALGRVTHREEITAGVLDPESVNDYLYDQPFHLAQQVNPTNLRGRLAQASWATGQVALSYDEQGRIDSRVFADADGAVTAIETHAYHADGSERTLGLLLTDTEFVTERVAYAYDSAGRERSAIYDDGTTTQSLFAATEIDPLGRLRQAQYGAATYTASYAETGRRLLLKVKVASPGAAHTREIAFPAPSGFPTAFDPLGRERGRKEAKDGDPGAPVLAYQYDQLGQLTNATRTPASVVLPNMQVTYDALGNLLTQTAGTGSSGARLSYQTVDRDRICSIAYGTGTPSTTCNVKYDSTGNIVEQPTRGNGKRTLSYFASGPVKQVTDTAGNDARFHYDAFGELQALELTSPTSPDTRHDERFGALVATRDELIGAARVPVMLRAIQTGGGIATRHGATTPAKWTFTFGESRGNRFVTDETGNFVQDVDYQAYGEPKSTGAQPGARSYTSAQWNGGDALVALGLSQLGARLYDPVIGRFLSRDPLLIPRTARTTNPYAFAINDPINEADPSGLERESTADEGDDPFEGWLTPNGEYDLSSWQNEYIYVSARGPAQEFSMSPFDVMLGIQGALHVSQPGAVGRAWNRMLDIDIALTRGAQRGVAQTVNAMIAPMRQVINDPWAAASKMSDPLFAARSLLDTVHGTGVFLGESAARIVSATSGEELAGVVAELGITVAVGIVMDRLMPGAPHAIPESPPPLRNIPSNAVIRVLTPVKGGSAYGVEYRWKNVNNQTVRWRVHGPDLSAPPGSNSATGITYRVQVGKRYMDAQGNLFPKNVHEPASPNYDPAAANATHIPFPSGLFNWFH